MLSRVAEEYGIIRDAVAGSDLTHAERLAILGLLRFEYERYVQEEIDSASE